MPKKAKETIVVAEDNKILNRELTRVLEKLGYTVAASVEDGDKAVQQTLMHKPDVVLMDVSMPVMDGLEAAAEIQRQCPTPIVILSAYDSQEIVEQAGKNGVGAYLTKPPEPEQIERAFTIAVARHKDLMTLRKLYDQLELKQKQLEKAVEEIKTLRGIIPICANCKRIKDDGGYWQQVEDYISNNSDAAFSHCICQDCMKKLYPDYYDEEIFEDDTK